MEPEYNFGPCPGCSECAQHFGFDDAENGDGDTIDGSGVAAFDAALDAGKVPDEGSFSWCGCGICGSELGGNRYVYHWIDSNGDINHGDDGCTDCLLKSCGCNDEEEDDEEE